MPTLLTKQKGKINASPPYIPQGSTLPLTFRDYVLPKNSNLFCLINIYRTKNNTHAHLSTLFGENKTIKSFSAGIFTSSFTTKGRRKTRLSQRMVYKSCLEKALGYGYKHAVIHIKGSRGSKVRIFRFFGEELNLLLIKDTSGVAHNGCRPPKRRRI
jgi:small subunit ribosomal protein S11